MNMLKNTREKLQNGKPLTIAALGDSLTQGWMVRKGYIDFVEQHLKESFPDTAITLINRGIPGDTADGGLYRLRRDVLDHNPDLVFVQFALNDAFTGCSSGSFKNNIRNIIEGIRLDCNAEILLITSVPIDSSRENDIALSFYQVLEELAETHQTGIARVHEHWLKRVKEGLDWHSLVQVDGVHPTVEGYRVMAEAVITALETE